MKKELLKLNNETSVDLEKLIQSRMVILANSGGGKSYLIRRLAEQAVDKVQTIILDPEGEFSSLREKYDFILAGKDADVPAEPRSAGLLATKLLELGKSAVVDLYELHPQERQRFVKLFCEALVNCPKSLYHPVLIILDEAHEYVPEGKPSEATWAVESLASKGRKRGQCLVLASQRIAKLSKNAAAECNNKLIGRASQDVDIKRAGDELGFTKERFKELRQLKPGEFFAFGPAISDEITKVKVGEVQTNHAKVGYKGIVKVPPASDVIKSVLGALKDLPQEAEKEAKTVAELKAENTMLKRELARKPSEKVIHDMTVPTRMIDEAVASSKKEAEAIIKKWQKRGVLLREKMSKAVKILEDFSNMEDPSIVPIDKYSARHPQPYFVSEPMVKMQHLEIKNPDSKDRKIEVSDIKLGACAKNILTYLSLRKGETRSKTQVAVATGYSQNSGGFNNAISELASNFLIERIGGGLLKASFDFYDQSLVFMALDTSLEKWTKKLGACARKIWEQMLDHVDSEWTKTRMAEVTGYSVNSGGFNNSISELSSLGLIERMQGGMIRINPEILNL